MANNYIIKLVFVIVTTLVGFICIIGCFCKSCSYKRNN